MTTAAPTRLAVAVAQAEDELVRVAPQLLVGFRAALPRAGDVVSRRLVAALAQESIGGLLSDRAGDRVRLPHGSVSAHRYAFDRVELTAPVTDEPAELLADLTGHAGPLAVELTDAVVKLALAYARDNAPNPATALAEMNGRDADDQVAWLERLGVDGHNLHPCGRTRLGWSIADCLDHDLESGATEVRFVAVDRRYHQGQDVGALLGAAYPGIPAAPPGYVVQPVHAWQLREAVIPRYGDLIAAGALRPLDVEPVSVVPTAALRTVLLPAGLGAARHYCKLSLDIQVTSTRRSVSVASTQNGPVLSALLSRLLADEPGVVPLAEIAGAAVTASGGRERDLAAIVRTGLTGRLSPGEVAVPGTALGPLLGQLLARFSATSGGIGVGAIGLGGVGLAFLRAYAQVLLPPLLRLAARYGVALEAHLQNSILTFVDGVPCRLVMRDFAGLRVHRPRLVRQIGPTPLWPGSVVVTDEVDVMRAKLGYTALQAHLGELIVRLVHGFGVDEAAAWRTVGEVLHEAYEPLRSDPLTSAQAGADHAFFTAATVPHKALVRMRLAGGTGGDMYLPVSNPLR
jgi:siderophore synthetase component